MSVTDEYMAQANKMQARRESTTEEFLQHKEASLSDTSVAAYREDNRFQRLMLRQAREEIEALRMALRSLGRTDI